MSLPFKTWLLVSALSLLSGCFWDTQIEYREVRIPIPVPVVIIPPEKPVMVFQQTDPASDIYTKLQKALAEIELRKGYELKLEADILPFSPENSKATFDRLGFPQLVSTTPK